MKRLLVLIFSFLLLIQPCFAWCWSWNDCDECAIKKLLESQVKYANRTNFKKFINTYDEKYLNSDGFNLEVYSNLIKDIWKTYDNIEYDIDIKKVIVDDNKATVELVETSFAKINMANVYDGELKSSADSIYFLEKINGKWKVVSDTVLEEMTSMLYGDATNLDVKLTTPNNIQANTEYCATLEFIPPEETIAIASIASDIVEYPQKPTEEVFRPLPEDNILERLFTSNTKNANEYIVASIGLTKTSIKDLSFNLKLTGFGYAIKRVNVIHEKEVDNNVEN